MVDRSILFETLSELTSAQLNKIIWVVGMPPAEQPAVTAVLGDRVLSLLQWAESPTGCGLDRIEAALTIAPIPSPQATPAPGEQTVVIPKRHYLLIEIRFPTSPSRGFPNEIKFWLFHDDQLWLSDTRPCERSLKGVQAAVIRLLDQLLGGDLKTKVNVRNLFLEFIISTQYLSLGIDEWSYRGTKLGVYHPVVLRWRDRTTGRDNTLGCQVWGTVVNQIKACPKLCQTPTVFWLPDEGFQLPGKLATHVSRSLYGACIGFSVVPDMTKESVEKNLLLTCLQNGVPFAFWSREPKDWVAFKKYLDELVANGTLDDLPLRIRELRENAIDNPVHHGSALAFLWDDPRRNPMAHKLIPFK